MNRGQRGFKSNRQNFYFIVIAVIVFLGCLLYFMIQLHHPRPKMKGKHLDIAIIVLGGGLTSDGKVPTHTQLRLDKAVQLYRQFLAKYGKPPVIITLSGGTPHKPNPLDEQGFPIWEATAAAKRLIELSIPAEDILEENFSLDTVGNAYFVRATHIMPGHYHHLHIVTNYWHMPRTKAIFAKVFSLPDIHPHEESFFYSFVSRALITFGFIDTKANTVSMHFEEVDAGISDQSALEARRQREEQSLQDFLVKSAPQWNTWNDLYQWIFSQHNAYAASRLVNARKTVLSQEALKSY